MSTCVTTPLDIPDLDKRAQLIFERVDQEGWAAWTEAGADADHCTIRIGRSRAEDPVVTTVWERDPATGRTNLVDAEGDGRLLPGINAVLAYLIEEMEIG
jgi:hypothetical protein